MVYIERTINCLEMLLRLMLRTTRINIGVLLLCSQVSTITTKLLSLLHAL
ncbi:hypothetical protein Ahy_A03g012722 isoform I [Arachis hypogaea]|uniref:Uncharacterized protein n=1 Tax=Arachis hypogaea TaxID=3818 RepID=A0A445DU05_ARAHY|nr:hypothetical protein Ahy_A03g012722 isoform I [Arachis hypogaea]